MKCQYCDKEVEHFRLVMNVKMSYDFGTSSYTKESEKKELEAERNEEYRCPYCDAMITTRLQVALNYLTILRKL